MSAELPDRPPAESLTPGEGWQSWESAWWQALYGPGGFYRRPEGPAGHFRTAAHAAGPALAAAIRRLALELGCTAIVDVGAGRGELLTALAELDRDTGGKDADGKDSAGPRLFGVDVVPRPALLPSVVGWAAALTGEPHRSGFLRAGRPDSAQLPDAALSGALVIGWELLDVVPCPILELDADGVPQVLLVEPTTGRELPGEPIGPADQAWCERWWPSAGLAEGDRLEVGRTRDDFWAGLVQRAVVAGAAALLAVDYAHQRENRPPAGSLTGFRAGRAVPPRPDGSMDLTAHVAIDSVAAAGVAAGAASSTLSSQHAALRALGVRSQELLDPDALGGFAWLLQLL